MEREEYNHLYSVERTHWFYRGRRKILGEFIAAYAGRESHGLVIDVGTGTGVFLEELSRQGRAVGVDHSPEALRYISVRLRGRLVLGSATQLPLGDACADLVTAIDVLEHVENDTAAMAEIARVCRGVIVLTVPAFPFLWSEWDGVLHHKRRYTKPSLLALARSAGLEVVRCTYFNSILFPVIAVVRIARRVSGIKSTGMFAEHAVPSRPLNDLLFRLFGSTAFLRRVDLPFGVSLLAVLRPAAGRGKTTGHWGTVS